MKNRNIKARPIVDRGYTAAIFLDDVAAIIDGFTMTRHPCLATGFSRQRTPNCHVPSRNGRFIIPTDKRHVMSSKLPPSHGFASGRVGDDPRTKIPARHGERN